MRAAVTSPRRSARRRAAGSRPRPPPPIPSRLPVTCPRRARGPAPGPAQPRAAPRAGKLLERPRERPPAARNRCGAGSRRRLRSPAGPQQRRRRGGPASPPDERRARRPAAPFSPLLPRRRRRRGPAAPQVTGLARGPPAAGTRLPRWHTTAVGRRRRDARPAAATGAGRVGEQPRRAPGRPRQSPAARRAPPRSCAPGRTGVAEGASPAGEAAAAPRRHPRGGGCPPRRRFLGQAPPISSAKAARTTPPSPRGRADAGTPRWVPAPPASLGRRSVEEGTLKPGSALVSLPLRKFSLICRSPSQNWTLRHQRRRSAPSLSDSEHALVKPCPRLTECPRPGVLSDVRQTSQPTKRGLERFRRNLNGVFPPSAPNTPSSSGPSCTSRKLRFVNQALLRTSPLKENSER